MIIAALLAAAVAGGDASPATGQGSAPATTSSQPAATPVALPKPRDKIVCHYIPEPGSRLGGSKTCMTQTEWDRQRQDAHDATQDLQTRGATTSVPQ